MLEFLSYFSCDRQSVNKCLENGFQLIFRHKLIMPTILRPIKFPSSITIGIWYQSITEIVLVGRKKGGKRFKFTFINDGTMPWNSIYSHLLFIFREAIFECFNVIQKHENNIFPPADVTEDQVFISLALIFASLPSD